MKRFILLIDTDDTVSKIELPGQAPELSLLYDLIGCDLVESASTAWEDIILLVDESGWLRNAPKVNILASFIYAGFPANAIAGKAVLYKLNKRRTDWIGFSEDDANFFKEILTIEED